MLRHPVNHGLRWSEEDMWDLVEMYADNVRWVDIASSLKRTVPACVMKIRLIKWAYTIREGVKMVSLLEDAEGKLYSRPLKD